MRHLNVYALPVVFEKFTKNVMGSPPETGFSGRIRIVVANTPVSDVLSTVAVAGGRVLVTAGCVVAAAGARVGVAVSLVAAVAVGKSVRCGRVGWNGNVGAESGGLGAGAGDNCAQLTASNAMIKTMADENLGRICKDTINPPLENY